MHFYKEDLSKVKPLERQLSEKPRLSRSKYIVYHSWQKFLGDQSGVPASPLITDSRVWRKKTRTTGVGYAWHMGHICVYFFCNNMFMNETHSCIYVDFYGTYKSYKSFNVPQMFHALGHPPLGCSYSCCGSFGVHSNILTKREALLIR